MRGKELYLPSGLVDQVRTLRRQPFTTVAPTAVEANPSKSGSLLAHLAQRNQGDGEEDEDSDSDEGGPKPGLVDQMLARKAMARARSLNRATAKRFRPAAKYMTVKAPRVTDLLPDNKLTYLKMRSEGSDALNHYLGSLGLFSGSSRSSAATVEIGPALDERIAH